VRKAQGGTLLEERLELSLVIRGLNRIASQSAAILAANCHLAASQPMPSDSLCHLAAYVMTRDDSLMWQPMS
jgi:hypothetical protein